MLIQTHWEKIWANTIRWLYPCVRVHKIATPAYVLCFDFKHLAPRTYRMYGNAVIVFVFLISVFPNQLLLAEHRKFNNMGMQSVRFSHYAENPFQITKRLLLFLSLSFSIFLSLSLALSLQHSRYSIIDLKITTMFICSLNRWQSIASRYVCANATKRWNFFIFIAKTKQRKKPCFN